MYPLGQNGTTKILTEFFSLGNSDLVLRGFLESHCVDNTYRRARDYKLAYLSLLNDVTCDNDKSALCQDDIEKRE